VAQERRQVPDHQDVLGIFKQLSSTDIWTCFLPPAAHIPWALITVSLNTDYFAPPHRSHHQPYTRPAVALSRAEAGRSRWFSWMNLFRTL
jgi:hypothetical protein